LLGSEAKDEAEPHETAIQFSRYVSYTLKTYVLLITTAEEQLVKDHFQNNFLHETVEGIHTKLIPLSYIYRTCSVKTRQKAGSKNRIVRIVIHERYFLSYLVNPNRD